MENSVFTNGGSAVYHEPDSAAKQTSTTHLVNPSSLQTVNVHRLAYLPKTPVSGQNPLRVPSPYVLM